MKYILIILLFITGVCISANSGENNSPKAPAAAETTYILQGYFRDNTNKRSPYIVRSFARFYDVNLKLDVESGEGIDDIYFVVTGSKESLEKFICSVRYQTDRYIYTK